MVDEAPLLAVSPPPGAIQFWIVFVSKFQLPHPPQPKDTEHPHTPVPPVLLHTLFGPHLLLQEPQLRGSLVRLTQTLLHEVWAPGQTQALAEQLCPVGHA